jgi:hypothetical protein
MPLADGKFLMTILNISLVNSFLCRYPWAVG